VLAAVQIQELREAIVLPITHRDRFVKLGIKPPKGVLLHGPPGERRSCAVGCVRRSDLLLAGVHWWG
jgi:ATP-dependent 26S proteasome regulatory subunit